MSTPGPSTPPFETGPALPTTFTVQQAVQEATKGLVQVVSKPGFVGSLRSTWRKSSQHVQAQLFRFLRLFGVTIVPQVLAQLATGRSITGHSLRIFLISVAVPTAEVVWRQLHPTMTASAADAAPGVTIVPAQVGSPQGVDTTGTAPGNLAP